MKKKVVINVVLGILLVIVIAVAGFCWWQWDNIMAVKTAVTTSTEEIEERIAENDQRIEQAMQKVDGVTVRDLTDEEKEELKNGTLDREQALDLITSGGTAQTGSASGTGQTPSRTGAAQQDETPAETQQDANQQQLSRYIAEIYVMKAEYTAWLEQKYNEAMEKYAALDESERTTEAKYSIGMDYLDEALDKEEECDAQMADIEQKITALLTEMGEDVSLVDDIQAAYEEEKELKKAYYLGGQM